VSAAEPNVAVDGAPAGALPADSATPPDASLGDLARDTGAFAKAWFSLIASEAALAKVNLVRIILVALLVPAIAIGIVVGVNGIAVTLLYALITNWPLAFLGTAVLNIAILVWMLWMLRNWWRTLSLPRSRKALTGLWSSKNDVASIGESQNSIRGK